MVSVEDCAQDFLDRFSVEAVVHICTRLQGVFKRPPQKISVRDLKVRSPFKLPINLCALHQVSVQDLQRRSLGKISLIDLLISAQISKREARSM